jgi:hypothetical protein
MRNPHFGQQHPLQVSFFARATTWNGIPPHSLRCAVSGAVRGHDADEQRRAGPLSLCARRDVLGLARASTSPPAAVTSPRYNTTVVYRSGSPPPQSAR